MKLRRWRKYEFVKVKVSVGQKPSSPWKNRLRHFSSSVWQMCSFRSLYDNLKSIPKSHFRGFENFEAYKNCFLSIVSVEPQTSLRLRLASGFWVELQSSLIQVSIVSQSSFSRIFVEPQSNSIESQSSIRWSGQARVKFYFRSESNSVKSK